MDKDEDDENLFDPLKVVGACAGETTVVCFAEEYDEHNAMVLEPINSDETSVLIVQKSVDTDIWHDIEDDAVRSEILQKYMKSNRPDCMEVIE